MTYRPTPITDQVHFPIVKAIDKLVPRDDPNGWAGTAGELHAALTPFVPANVRACRGAWPSAPSGLGARVKNLAPALKALGISVMFYQSGTRTLHFVREALQQAA